MGTNYYRIPLEKDIQERQLSLIDEVTKLDISPDSIIRGFHLDSYNDDVMSYNSPWYTFLRDIKVHVGKRSSGWKFLWNFHKHIFYKNKEELFKYIRSGRIVNEYGELQDTEEFIKMALDWGQPDGHVIDDNYYKRQFDDKGKSRPNYISSSDHYDTFIDGLRISSSTEFS